MSAENPPYPYPREVPSCLRTGLVCGDCPWADVDPFDPDSCKYVAIGSRAISDRAMLQGTQEELQRQRQENRSSRYDRVLSDFFTTEGFCREIMHNEQLQKQLRKRKWGLLFCDLRGLKDTNDHEGKEKGDRLLRIAGRRIILEAGLRFLPRAVNIDYRQNPNTVDIGIRDGGGADELIALINDVDQQKFEKVAARQQNRFSVSRAILDSAQGLVPTILSVASVHASELEPLLSPLDAFNEAIRLADERHTHRKEEQYQEMWIRTLAMSGTDIEKPRDDRVIASMFTKLCCPDYADNMAERLIADELGEALSIQR